MRTTHSNTQFRFNASRRFPAAVNSRCKSLVAASVLGAATMVLSGCNDAQAGGLLGGGIGALAGQAIGHNTTGTLLGLGIGAGAGYIIGNESDKARYEADRHYSYNYYGPPPYEVHEYHYYHHHYYPRAGCSNYDY
jgi:hypothetical protein